MDDINEQDDEMEVKAENEIEGKDEEIDDGDDGYEFPPDDNVVDMLDEVPLDQELKIHSNRICMISLAPSHPVMQKCNEIEKINFKVTEKLDRASNKVSGKGKHGAQPLQENSNICFITLTNGETWPIKCCMIGKLIEVNLELVNNPQLIRELPHRGGYLAIVLPNIKVHETMRDKLLDEESYLKAVAQREENPDIENSNAIKRGRNDGDAPEREAKVIKTLE
ncbi:protein Abitram isoform X2 [Microplitis demolitor]|uniref:protein Abitram isoform X2 n=1 Tax=Microplitis demolitor TaxID=69319 RepID=UPI00235B5E29|nr:protein Abitram isoform X2 [Microplitis demolitor]